jgi:hypothetical protein
MTQTRLEAHHRSHKFTPKYRAVRTRDSPIDDVQFSISYQRLARADYHSLSASHTKALQNVNFTATVQTSKAPNLPNTFTRALHAPNHARPSVPKKLHNVLGIDQSSDLACSKNQIGNVVS